MCVVAISGVACFIDNHNSKSMGIYDWKPEVGMEVYVVPYYAREEPFVGKVTKVGHKYFEVKSYLKFNNIDKQNRRDGYTPDYRCYRSKADYDHERDINLKRNFIKVRMDKLTDEQVNMVFDWVKEEY